MDLGKKYPAVKVAEPQQMPVIEAPERILAPSWLPELEPVRV